MVAGTYRPNQGSGRVRGRRGQAPETAVILAVGIGREVQVITMFCEQEAQVKITGCGTQALVRDYLAERREIALSGGFEWEAEGLDNNIVFAISNGHNLFPAFRQIDVTCLPVVIMAVKQSAGFTRKLINPRHQSKEDGRQTALERTAFQNCADFRPLHKFPLFRDGIKTFRIKDIQSFVGVTVNVRFRQRVRECRMLRPVNLGGTAQAFPEVAYHFDVSGVNIELFSDIAYPTCYSAFGPGDLG